MHVFSSLLAPHPLPHFFAEHWTQRALFIPSKDATKFQHLFSWNDLNHLLNYHQIRYPDLRFSRDGEPLPAAKAEDWLEMLHQGATLIINSVHRRLPKLADLVANIRQDTGHRSQINLYCSPLAQKGFNCHYDDHEVLILQIAGRKEWLIFPETIAAPVAALRSADQLPPDVPPYLQCTLEPGDVLYIPRGHWHYAIACTTSAAADPTPALHLTLGIDCQTGLDWLHWLKDERQDEPDWRANVPLIPQGDTTAARAQLEQWRDQLIAWLQTSEPIDNYLNFLGYSDRPPLPFGLPYQLGSQIFEQGLETRWKCSPLHPVQMTATGPDQTQIIVAAKQATVKGLPTDIVTQLFRPEGFSLLDLADWAPDLDLETVVIPLLTQLVTQGILQVDVPAAPDG
jgi:ribosomal protein L16 Arg81 hydroxylase